MQRRPNQLNPRSCRRGVEVNSPSLDIFYPSISGVYCVLLLMLPGIWPTCLAFPRLANRNREARQYLLGPAQERECRYVLNPASARRVSSECRLWLIPIELSPFHVQRRYSAAYLSHRLSRQIGTYEESREGHITRTLLSNTA